MKITKKFLQKIIQEETTRGLKEFTGRGDTAVYDARNKGDLFGGGEEDIDPRTRQADSPIGHALGAHEDKELLERMALLGLHGAIQLPEPMAHPIDPAQSWLSEYYPELDARQLWEIQLEAIDRIKADDHHWWNILPEAALGVQDIWLRDFVQRVIAQPHGPIHQLVQNPGFTNPINNLHDRMVAYHRELSRGIDAPGHFGRRDYAPSDMSRSALGEVFAMITEVVFRHLPQLKRMAIADGASLRESNSTANDRIRVTAK